MLLGGLEFGRVPLMNYFSSLSCWVATIWLFLGLQATVSAGIRNDGKTVLCFVGHKTSHGFGNHEYSAGNHLIEEWLKKTYPSANIEARHAIPWPENEDEFFKDADSVIIFCSGGGGHVVNNHVPAFDKVMRTGAGLACLHYAVEVPIGPSAKGMLAWMGGYFEMNWSVNPHWVAEFKTFPTDHPAARGITPFKADDEWYFHMRFQGDMNGVTPILSAIAPLETMSRGDGPHSGNPAVRKSVSAGEPQHVAWAYQRGQDYNDGRGFGFTGLHYHWNWQDPNFRKTVLNGVAWSANLEIPENGIETETPTREYLTENAAKWGGDQGRKSEGKPVVGPANPNAKPLFESGVVRAFNPVGNAVAIDVAIPDGSTEIFLRVDDVDGLSCDWVNWAEPRFVMGDGSEKRLIDLDWKAASTGWGKVRKNLNIEGGQMKVLDKAIEYGVGTHAPSLIAYDLPAGAKRFKARGALDDGGTVQQNGKTSSVIFSVFNVNPGTAPKHNSKDAVTNRTPEEALPSLEVHPELEAQLFASEPMIASPSSIDIDARGRVWVCDVVNYRSNQGKRDQGDRIMILEDTDGDAKADKSTVFYQGKDVDSAHGICVLGDRVIISAGEEIFSLYDRNSDGKADEGSKEMMFTKIGGKQHDHGIHAVHFGPDGRLYFNFGNAGKQLCDSAGNLITDIHGVPCTNSKRPYQQGMVFRCDLDTQNVEMLGWNFRNNWEVCVDAYGNLWQSDNDDDGNKGVRINYVMEYGNYGYNDENTGAGWRDSRPGMEEEIPKRHWHLNDPGVVPNLLQTGAGSPTGICVYEGVLLPKVFQGKVIHCDAGPNVVRAYPVKSDGAGYTAEIVDILKSKTDNWFRPSDVCVAPDGSLFVADWYDPGVGGHGMRDIERGRIFRVIPKGKAVKYTVEEANLKSVAGAYAALNSPNMSTRFSGWTSFAGVPEDLKKSIPPREQARVQWKTKNTPLNECIEWTNPDLAVAGLRMIRQGGNAEILLAAVNHLFPHKSPRVRQECALSLRFLNSESASQAWAKLAKQYDGKDRWYLEALGIGADLYWDSRLAALGSDIHPDIVWRSRGTKSAGMITDILTHNTSGAEIKFLRALDFQPAEVRAQSYARVFMDGNAELALIAAGKISRNDITKLEGGNQRLKSLLDPVRGKTEFVTLAERLHLTGFEEELADYIAKNPSAPEAVTAAGMLIQNGGKARDLLSQSSDLNRTSAIATAIGRTNDRAVSGILLPLLLKNDTPLALRTVLIDAMATGSNSSRDLIKSAREGKLDPSLKDIAALALARSPDQKVRSEAAEILPVPKAPGADSFPDIAALVSMKGDAAKGESLFIQATCATCHKVKGKGIEFGPDLSEIGKKLSREGMFQAILYPSAAISHGFHGLNITKNDGSSLVGFSTGETNTELQVRLPGGAQQSIAKKEIKSQEALEQSLMPPGLANVVGVQGLVDLVTWMQSLK